MNSRQLLYLPKVLFVLLLVCSIIMIGFDLFAAQHDTFFCCVTDANPWLHLWQGPLNLLLSAFLAYGTLNSFYKITRGQLAIGNLLRHKKPVPERLEHEVPELKSVRTIFIDIETPIAFCCGFLRPSICFSRGLVAALSTDELRATILHEVHHCRNFDPLCILGISIIKNILFFMPAINEWQALYQTGLELKADRFAIQGAGKPALAGAIRRFMSFSKPDIPLLRQAIITEFSSVPARVAELLEQGLPRAEVSYRSLLQSSATILLFCTLLT